MAESCTASYGLVGGRRRRKSHKKRARRGGSMLATAAPVLSLLALNQYLHKTMGRKGRKSRRHRRRSFRR